VASGVAWGVAWVWLGCGLGVAWVLCLGPLTFWVPLRLLRKHTTRIPNPTSSADKGLSNFPG